MRLRRSCLPFCLLMLLAACADAPTLPVAQPGTGPREHVTPLPGSGSCDPWLDASWCDDPGEPDDPCITAYPGPVPGDAFVNPQGCETGGGPGAGTELPPDTCRTGEPVLDDPAVRAGLKDLWTRSNPDSGQAKRLEQGAWLVRNGDGSYGLMPFSVTAQGPCGINGNLVAPAGTLAFVHTHPFSAREVQAICGAIKQFDPVTGGFRDVIGPGGVPVYPVYSNRPSIPDHDLMRAINRARTDLGMDELWGLIIDANQTTLYTFDPNDAPIAFRRCGY